MLELILGGARSGKSRLAQQRALESKLQPIYIATAQADDAEMQERIAQHRRDRDASWQVIEEPYCLADALAQQCHRDHCVVVDCLTLWLSNLLHANDKNPELNWNRQRHALLEQLPQLPGHTILVTNEVSLGVVPMGELSRRFVDESGRLHQDLAQLCQRVTLTVAGLPHCLKDE